MTHILYDSNSSIYLITTLATFDCVIRTDTWPIISVHNFCSAAAVYVLQVGMKAAYSKIKLYLPHNRWSNDPFSNMSTQERDWAIPQLTNFIKDLLCVFKSALKLQPNKRSCILLAVTGAETLGIRSVPLIETSGITSGTV